MLANIRQSILFQYIETISSMQQCGVVETISARACFSRLFDDNTRFKARSPFSFLVFISGQLSMLRRFVRIPFAARYAQFSSQAWGRFSTPILFIFQ